MDTVRYEDLLPHQFRLRLAECPVAYLPLGTLEWHGEHLPLGSDAIISHGLMIKAAEKLGGIVMPPIYVGPDRSQLQLNGSQLQGMDTADVTTPHRQLDGGASTATLGAKIAAVKQALSALVRPLQTCPRPPWLG